MTVLAHLNKDAMLALGLLKDDISVVSAAAGTRGVSPLLLQHALRCASEAFSASGDAQHPAWSDLVMAIDDILTYRSQFALALDAASLERLRRFVHDNADALRREDELLAS